MTMPLNVAFIIALACIFGSLFLDWKEQDRRRRELDAKADALLRQADAVAALSGRPRSYSPPPSLPPPEFHIPHSWGIARIIGAWLLIAAHPIVYGLLAAIVASLLWPAAGTGPCRSPIPEQADH